MNNDRCTILGLIAAGRITPREAERLLAAVNESREMAWILAFCLAYAVLAQIHLHELLPGLLQFFNVQIPALAGAIHHGLSLITDLNPLPRIGGLL